MGNEIATMSTDGKTYWSNRYKQWDEEILEKVTWQLVVPECRCPDILQMIHDHSTGGHWDHYIQLAHTSGQQINHTRQY